jgi:hypothetical protein
MDFWPPSLPPFVVAFSQRAIMRDRRSLLIAICCGLALCGGPARAARQSSADDACSRPLRPPAGLALTLSLKNDQTVFRVGEIITLVTSYTSQNEHKYIWDSKSYDRSGRNSIESFCIKPDAGRDPMRDYFDAQMATLGGGLFSDSQLSHKPQIAELDLNEYTSLPPGKYHLSVVGYRVKVGSETNPKSWDNKPIPLRSNEVEFTVIEADPAWQAAQIQSAVAELDRGNYQVKTRNANGDAVYFDSDARRFAKRMLRFLGTRDSEHQLAIMFANTPNGETTREYAFGLWAAEDRTAVLDDMRTILRTHSQMNNEFVQELVQMEMYSDPLWRSMLHHDDPEKGWDHYLDEFNRRTAAYNSEIGKDHR